MFLQTEARSEASPEFRNSETDSEIVSIGFDWPNFMPKWERMIEYEHPPAPIQIDCPVSAQIFFQQCFAETDPWWESLWVAHIDDKGNCLKLMQYPGDENSVFFPLRDIIFDALAHDAAGIALAHNHPSGNPRPSTLDLTLTRILVTVAEPLGCRVIDHLIFGGEECSSMRKMGLL